MSQLRCYAAAKGDVFKAEALFRTEHMDSLLSQYNPEFAFMEEMPKVNDVSDEKCPSCPTISYNNTEDKPIAITTVEPFYAKFHCKKCSHTLLTRNL